MGSLKVYNDQQGNKVYNERHDQYDLQEQQELPDQQVQPDQQGLLVVREYHLIGNDHM